MSLFNNIRKDYSVKGDVNIINSPFYINNSETILLNLTDNTLTADLKELGTPNTYGSSTQIPVISVDKYGRITEITTQTISTLLLQTNGVDNVDQNLLNLIQGTNITLTDDGFGGIIIASTGGGGSITAVTATSPITSSGGSTPDISTSMNTNKLIGRSTSGIGVMEEITVGTGLSLSSGTLSATGVAGSVGFEMNFLLMGA
jgi:hypothetical protein